MASTRSTLSVRTTAADAHGIRVFQLLVAGMAIAFVATGAAIGLP